MAPPRHYSSYCVVDGCPITATFGCPYRRKRLYCATHKRYGNVLLNGRRCIAGSCIITASYGQPGSKRLTRCGTHKHPKDVSRMSRCKVCRVLVPIGMKSCDAHKPPGDELVAADTATADADTGTANTADTATADADTGTANTADTATADADTGTANTADTATADTDTVGADTDTAGTDTDAPFDALLDTPLFDTTDDMLFDVSPPDASPPDTPLVTPPPLDTPPLLFDMPQPPPPLLFADIW